MEMKENNTQLSNEENFTVLSAMSDIVAKSRDSKLSEDFFKAIKAPVAYLAKMYKLTPMQCVLFSLIAEGDGYDNISIGAMIKNLGCSRLLILQYSNDIEELERRQLIVLCNAFMGHEVMYSIPGGIMESIVNNKPHVVIESDKPSFGIFFKAVDNFLSQLRNHCTKYDETEVKINKLLEENKDLHFVKAFNALNYDSIDKMILLILCSVVVNQASDKIDFEETMDLLPSGYQYTLKKFSFLHSTNQIMKDKLIDVLIQFDDDTNISGRILCIPKKTISQLLPEVPVEKDPEVKYAADDEDDPEPFDPWEDDKEKMIRRGPKNQAGRMTGDMIASMSIPEKKLFYNAREQQIIDELCDSLKEENYSKIAKRMHDRKMRGGFKCLFYGAPGTGKTESVMQIARMTGRDIMQVNIAAIRDKFVGESEKNVKAIFDNYRELRRNSKMTPILLFNEADGLINKRSTKGDSSSERMENAMQNIFLQEMEVFEGILIATTNLQCNLDKAFERRFLYKIQFNKPDKNARKLIWMDEMPFLQDTDAEELACKYEFSGGEIDNIAQKHEINFVLHGDEADSVEVIKRCCEDEKLGSEKVKAPGREQMGRKRIGF